LQHVEKKIKSKIEPKNENPCENPCEKPCENYQPIEKLCENFSICQIFSDCSNKPDMRGSGEGKRKRRERVTLDEIVMIDMNTERQNKKKKKGKIQKKVEKEEKLATTPPNSPEILTFELDSPLIMPFAIPTRSQSQEEDEEEEEIEEEGSMATQEEMWPGTTKEWWIQVVLVPKFQDRLGVAWKNLSKSFKGSCLMPCDVFSFFFGTFEKKMETENRIKKVIKTKQTLKKLDQILMTSDWRKRSFYHQDSTGDIFQGTCRVVLEVEKKIEWAGGGFVTCLSPLEFSYDRKNSLFSFSGVVEGRNKVRAFRF
jgi:hypothetical protein